MEKSRLGISINLFAALIYFVCIINNLLACVIVTGYVLFFEESERLKRIAVKALIITIFLAVVFPLSTYILYFIIYMLQIVQTIITANNIYNNSYVFTNISNYIQQIYHYVIYSAQIIIPVIFGLRAYKQKDIKIKVIDNILDKHL